MRTGARGHQSVRDSVVFVEEIRQWPGLRLDRRIEEGNRNEVWTGSLNGHQVAVRRSRRSPESLRWELGLLRTLSTRGFDVPEPMPTSNGSLSHDGVVVQRWLDGRPPVSDADWQLVAAELARLHATCGDIPQRPGCLAVTELSPTSRSVDADLREVPDEVTDLVLRVFTSFVDQPVSLIHGDPTASNIRITDDDTVGLLDWDESRVDVTWHDLSNLGVVVLDPESHRRANELSNAWEAINAWTCEPEYAKSRLANLLT